LEIGEAEEITTSVFQILDKFVIRIDARWKKVFDLLMVAASVHNVLSNAYYAAMKTPERDAEVLLDLVVESLFLGDMAFCFFFEYKDPETYQIVSDFRAIALNYTKKSFVFDLLAWIPFGSLVSGEV
jgi:hypothetical protein